MAKITFSGLGDITTEINRRTKKAVEKVPKMLASAAEVLVEAQKAEVDILINESKVRDIGIPSRSLGDLKRSIKATKIKEDKAGARYIEVYPQGKDGGGVRNETKGFVLEYGRSNMDGYAWMTAASEKSAEAMTDAMQKVWQEDNE